MQLTENFSLEELIASAVAAREGMDNSPGHDIVAHLQRLAEGQFARTERLTILSAATGYQAGLNPVA